MILDHARRNEGEEEVSREVKDSAAENRVVLRKLRQHKGSYECV